ncbi:hypothetical protein ABKV19_026833 [Rosa sericea]
MDKYDGRVCMSSESMSRIEAMFEAELERLGLNRSTSTLERRLTDLDELPNSVHQVSEDYVWESSVLYRPMFTSEEVEILSLNQFLLAIRHAHLRSETMLLLHHQSFDFSHSFGSQNITRTYLVAPNGHRTQGLGSLEMSAPAVNNRLLLLDLQHQIKRPKIPPSGPSHRTIKTPNSSRHY